MVLRVYRQQRTTRRRREVHREFMYHVRLARRSLRLQNLAGSRRLRSRLGTKLAASPVGHRCGRRSCGRGTTVRIPVAVCVFFTRQAQRRNHLRPDGYTRVWRHGLQDTACRVCGCVMLHWVQRNTRELHMVGTQWEALRVQSPVLGCKVTLRSRRTGCSSCGHERRLRCLAVCRCVEQLGRRGDVRGSRCKRDYDSDEE